MIDDTDDYFEMAEWTYNVIADNTAGYTADFTVDYLVLNVVH